MMAVLLPNIRYYPIHTFVNHTAVGVNIVTSFRSINLGKLKQKKKFMGVAVSNMGALARGLKKKEPEENEGRSEGSSIGKLTKIPLLCAHAGWISCVAVSVRL